MVDAGYYTRKGTVTEFKRTISLSDFFFVCKSVNKKLGMGVEELKVDEETKRA